MITDLLIRKLALAGVALAIVVVGVLALQLLLGSLNVFLGFAA